jgi:CheY-like chemotaxis protein
MQQPILLLVEDSEDDAFFFCRTFQMSGAGLTVHHVKDGQAAMEFLEQSFAAGPLPRIMFLDLKMPVMNGFELLAWLRKQTYCAKIPVIVLSGSDHQNDIDRANELGAVSYLVKPATTDDFRRLLHTFAGDVAMPGPLGKGVPS